MNILDLIPLNDFSLIEQAVQTFFCGGQYIAGTPFIEPPVEWEGDDGKDIEIEDGQIAFYTAFQNNTFQKARPRVGIALHSINKYEGEQVIDSEFVLRPKAWRAQMRFQIVTGPDYDVHRQLRALVNAIIPKCGPTYQSDGSGIATGGVNGILTNHQVGLFEAQNESTNITPQEGYYVSPITVNLTFSLNAKSLAILQPVTQ